MPMIPIALLALHTRKWPPAYAITSIAIALAGALLVITNGSLAFFVTASDQLFPLLLIFTGVVGWVVYSMGSARFGGWSTLRYSTLTCLLGTGVSFGVVATATLLQWIPAPSWESISSIRYEMAFMVLLPGLVALLSWNEGIKGSPAQRDLVHQSGSGHDVCLDGASRLRNQHVRVLRHVAGHFCPDPQQPFSAKTAPIREKAGKNQAGRGTDCVIHLSGRSAEKTTGFARACPALRESLFLPISYPVFASPPLIASVYAASCFARPAGMAQRRFFSN